MIYNGPMPTLAYYRLVFVCVLAHAAFGPHLHDSWVSGKEGLFVEFATVIVNYSWLASQMAPVVGSRQLPQMRK